MKKRVLFLTSSAHLSGAENVVLTIIKALKNDYEFAYATLGTGDIFSYLKQNKIKYYIMERNTKHCLKKIIDDFKPDVIHANDFKASILMAFSSFSGKKISHIHQCPPFIKTINLKSLIYWYSIKKYDAVISVSDYFKINSIFKDKLKDKCYIIPNIIDVARINTLISKINNDAVYDFAYFGRLEQDKNPLEFIEIMKKYQDFSHSSIRAIMVGEGSLKELCQSKIEEYELVENIKLVGFLNNPFSEIQKSKLIIMPSKNEGFGLTAVESMYLGKPVLNSGVGGLGEIFQQHMEFICKSEKEFVEKIDQFFDRYTYYQRISKEIASRYVDIVSWAKKFNVLYKD